MAEAVPYTDFFELLLPYIGRGSEINLPDTRVFTGRRGTGTLTASVGNALWYGKVNLEFARGSDALNIQSRIENIMTKGLSFMGTPFTNCRPLSDRLGMNAALPLTLGAVLSDNYRIRIDGLPPAFNVSPGDFVSWTYLNSPIRHAFHRVNSGGRANANGQVFVGLAPLIRPGSVAGVSLSLYSPRFKADIMPQSVKWPTNGKSVFMSFEFQQVLGR